jgi:acyl-CoA synthetase (NDP forming)
MELPKFSKIDNIFELVKQDNRTVLTEIEAKQVMEGIGIPTPEYHLAQSVEEAVDYAGQVGFPVVLKVVSPEIIHKSDAKGVLLNLQTEEEVKEGYERILKNAQNFNPNARVLGISVQKMLKSGVEVIVGVKRDNVFGPVVLFGLGGIFVELLKDVSLRVLPLAEQDIKNMMKEIQGYPLLDGYRGSKPIDFQSLESIIFKIAQLCTQFSQISELELNPIIAYEDGAWAADARILMESK